MYLVFNTGGTNTKVGISTDGEALDKYSVFPTYENFDRQLERLEQEAAKLKEGGKLQRVAGGVAGVWMTDRSKLFYSPYLSQWEKVPIKKQLEEVFGVKATLANDVEMEGLGEATTGAGRRKRIVVYIGAGTGIGGVKIADGKVIPRVYGFEPGHQIIAFGEDVNYLESFAGGAAMEKIYGKPPEEIDDEEVWERETQLLAIGVHNAIVFWSPEIVILGGSLMKKIKLAELKTKIASQMQRLPKLPIITEGELGEKAGLYGALNVIKSPAVL